MAKLFLNRYKNSGCPTLNPRTLSRVEVIKNILMQRVCFEKIDGTPIREVDVTTVF